VGAKRKRVRAFVALLYAVVLLELVLAVGFAVAGPVVAALPLLAAAVLTGALARALWRDFELRGENHWLYSWRGLHRKLRG
jgi:hypothetical protein